jgi:hypothetical protein
VAKKNELAAVGEMDYPIMSADLNLSEIVQANLGDGGASRFDLDRVQIPAAGGTMWMIPTLEGPKAQATLEGIIIDSRQSRAYWEKSLEESGGAEPDCKSDDGKMGVGMPGGSCADCTMAQWGSDPKGGSGQACKLKQSLLIVPKGSVLPILLDLPVSSIKEWRKFALRLINARRSFWSVTVTIGLKTMDKPVKHSVAQFAVGEMLSEEDTAKTKAYAESLLAAVGKK